ncbi:hypothetical protein FGG08_002681 [Glutinoglossum americanum]|uniref:Uncharacterized protein n=1 Tax=Glutinoglossum americanum TaxID=1670608 RepID=A0A9P8I4D1_9PEZI|nr:hypothetical protein FGG08_002681 [Glutinoglossum americanum]
MLVRGDIISFGVILPNLKNLSTAPESASTGILSADQWFRKPIRYAREPESFIIKPPHPLVLVNRLGALPVGPFFAIAETQNICMVFTLSAGNGHEAAVILLLAKDGVDPDSEGGRGGRTPLSWAASPLWDMRAIATEVMPVAYVVESLHQFGKSSYH